MGRLGYADGALPAGRIVHLLRDEASGESGVRRPHKRCESIKKVRSLFVLRNALFYVIIQGFRQLHIFIFYQHDNRI